MSSYILKTAHVSLIQLFQSTMMYLKFFRLTENHDLTAIQAIPNLNSKLRTYLAMTLVKSIICPSLTSSSNSLPGISWLIPLMLNRESQIRSMSISLLSSLLFNEVVQDEATFNSSAFQLNVNTYLEPLFKISINIMLNNYECSSVRTQACSLLINYVKSTFTACKVHAATAESSSKLKGSKRMAPERLDQMRKCLSRLRANLSEVRFFERVCNMFSNFYPFKTYDFYELKSFFHTKSSSSSSDVQSSEYWSIFSGKC